MVAGIKALKINVNLYSVEIKDNSDTLICMALLHCYQVHVYACLNVNDLYLLFSSACVQAGLYM